MARSSAICQYTMSVRLEGWGIAGESVIKSGNDLRAQCGRQVDGDRMLRTVGGQRLEQGQRAQPPLQLADDRPGDP